MIYVTTHAGARRNARGRSAQDHPAAASRCLYRRAAGNALIKETDNPAHKIAEPRRLPTTRRALPHARLAQISQVTAALRAATLAAMPEPACPRRAEPGQAMAAAAQQPPHPMTAPYRRDNGNPASSLISAPACYKASLRAGRSQREIRRYARYRESRCPLTEARRKG
jgi:hypothetical protein